MEQYASAYLLEAITIWRVVLMALNQISDERKECLDEASQAWR